MVMTMVTALRVERPVATLRSLRVLRRRHHAPEGVVHEELGEPRPRQLAGLVLVHCDLVLPARAAL